MSMKQLGMAMHVHDPHMKLLWRVSVTCKFLMKIANNNDCVICLLIGERFFFPLLL